MTENITIKAKKYEAIKNLMSIYESACVGAKRIKFSYARQEAFLRLTLGLVSTVKKILGVRV